MSEHILSVPVRLRPNDLDCSFPAVSKPKPFGCFHVNAKREYEDDAIVPNFLWVPTQMPLDLNAGLDKVQHKPTDPPNHDMLMLCKFIYNHQQLLHEDRRGNLHLTADFVTLRGILRRIMTTPYSYIDDYRFLVQRVNGNIYISKIKSKMEEESEKNMNEFYKNAQSWGFKFEQYCSTQVPKTPPDTNQPVIEAEEFCCVYSNEFGSHKLLFAAEMDCIRSDHMVNLNSHNALRNVEFVELKTTAQIQNSKQQYRFNKYKTINWWSQSFLVGVETIYAGIRDNNGMVHSIEEFRVRDLARHKPWDPTVTAVFLDRFLTQLKLLMEQLNDPKAVVQVELKPDKDLVVYQILDKAESILPTWYLELLKGRNAF